MTSAAPPALETFCRHLHGAFSFWDIQELLQASPALAESLGKTEYLDLLAFNGIDDSEASIKRRLGEICERRFPGELLKIRARHLCAAILDGSMAPLEGSGEMNRLHWEPAGRKIIPIIFTALDSEWDTQSILKAAREFLAGCA